MLGTLLLPESCFFWPNGPIVFVYQILLLNETGLRYVFKPFFLGHDVKDKFNFFIIKVLKSSELTLSA